MRLYTDIDPYCCAVLRARVADGGLPPGDVLCADISALVGGRLRDTLRRYRAVHLFSGIGASPLGLRWAHWPDEWSVLTGGFPCQDISSAGRGAGLDGARSGLFWEMIRAIRVCQPSCVIAENVGALSARGLDRVVGALGEVGYEVHALRMGAWAVGAPHERERWWIVGEPTGSGLEGHRAHSGKPEGSESRYAMPQRWPAPYLGAHQPSPQHDWEAPRLYQRRVGDGPDGLPARVALYLNKRGVEALGNAQVPECVRVIARAIMDSLGEAA